MHDPSERAGVRLRETRERLRLSRREVSRRTGVGVLALARYERGRRVPDSVLATLARAYGVAPGEVVPSRSRSRLEVHDGEIAAGPASRPLPEDADEVAVLHEYLDLVRELRGLDPRDELPIRDADLPELAAVVGDRPQEIEDRLMALVSCTREEAQAIRRALVTRRLIAPAAGFVIGVSGLTPALAQDGAGPSTTAPTGAAPTAEIAPGPSGSPGPPPPTTAAPTTSTTAPSDASPVPEPDPEPPAPDPAPGHRGGDEGHSGSEEHRGGEGHGEDGDGSSDRAPDEPSGEDWAEIGEAVVIERDPD